MPSFLSCDQTLQDLVVILVHIVHVEKYWKKLDFQSLNAKDLKNLKNRFGLMVTKLAYIDK